MAEYYNPDNNPAKKREQAEEEERLLVEFRRASDAGLRMGWQAFLAAKARGDDVWALDAEQRTREAADGQWAGR